MSWKNDLSNIETRREVLQSLKAMEDRSSFYQELETDEAFFLDILKDQDSKVRRLFAQILADSQKSQYRDILLETYLNEPQRMILASLVKSLQNFDLSDVLESLEQRELILQKELEGEMSKHAKEELHALRQVLKPYRVLPKHQFIGLKKEIPMILTMPNGHQEALMDELIWVNTKKTSLGVQVKTSQLERLFESHLFASIYFPLCKTESMEIETIASMKVVNHILKFLNSCHQGDFAYRIRVNAEDTAFSRKVAEAFEIISHQQLQNHPSDYEIEIRIRENKFKEGIIYLKLLTIPDYRFDYRKKVSSSSLAGHTASLIAHYLQDYVKPEGQVLDPLCNDGTLLIERCYAAQPHFVMGLDMNSDLMEMAKCNANKADVDIRFVQRDIQTFHHKREFDEMLTKLPTIVSKENQDAVTRLYKGIFNQIPQLMANGAIVAFYTTETKLIEKLAQHRRSYLELKRKIPMIGKQYLYIFEVVNV